MLASTSLTRKTGIGEPNLFAEDSAIAPSCKNITHVHSSHGSLCPARGDHGVVFLLRLRRQQNPKSVCAHDRAEGNVEKRDKSQHEGENAGPRLPLHESPTGDESDGGLGQDENTDYAKQRTKKSSWRFGRCSELVEMRKQSVGQDIQDHAPNGVERGDGKPENSEQVKMRLHPPGTLLQGCHWSDDLLPALAAECLSRLHRGTASIAEHLFLHADSECRDR